MFEFNILGRIELLGDQRAPIRSILSQPKRVALLAYLAASKGEATSRERLSEIFWPGSDRGDANHSLSQAIYAVRRSLGKRTLATEEPGYLTLDPSRISTDLWGFHACVDRGDLLDALDLYRGELLDGLPVNDLPPFERWLDEERERLRRKAKSAALELSERMEGEGDLQEAVRWTRRAMELAPYEELPFRRLLLLLHSRGDRGRARAEFERFENALGADLDVEPSEETRELAARISEGGGDLVLQGSEERRESSKSVDLTGPVPRGEGGVSVRSSGILAGDPERQVASGRDASAAPAQGVQPGLPGSLRAWIPSPWVLAAAGGTFVFLLALVFLPPRSDVVTAPSPNRIAVLPFTFHGSGQYQYLGEGVAELLGISLGGLEHIATVDPRSVFSQVPPGVRPTPSIATAEAVARQFGANYFVLGSVLEAGGRLQITASLYRTGTGRVATHQGRAEDESGLFELVDDLVRHFVASEGLPRSTHLVRTAAATTHSLAALKHFLRGEQLFRIGRYHEALAAFLEAAALDESFALAHYRAGVAFLWTGSDDFDLARESAARALEHQSRVPESQRPLIRALQAFLQGTGREAERLYREALEIHPDNPEAWFNLGEVLFHYGPLMGRSVTTSRAAWERVITFDPDHRGALVHLASIAALEGRTNELEQLVLKIEGLQEEGELALQIEGLAAWTYGGPERQDRLIGRLPDESPRRIRQAASYAARYLNDLEASIQIASALTAPERPVSERTEGHVWLAYLTLAAGRPSEARSHLEAAQRYDPIRVEPFRKMLAATPEVRVELWALAYRGELLLQEDPPGVAYTLDAGMRIPHTMSMNGEPESGIGVLEPLHPYLDALAVPSEIRTAAMLRATGERTRGLAEGSGQRTIVQLASQSLHAEADLMEGRPGSAAMRLERSLDEVELWYELLRVSPIYSLARERYRLAELLIIEGRLPEAIQWLTALTESSLGEVVYLVPAHLRLAELHDQLGHPHRARAHYARILAIWERADPELEPIRAEIGARLELLPEEDLPSHW